MTDAALLQAAQRAIEAHGYAGATLERIADEAGLDYAQQSLKLYSEVDSEFGRAVASDTSGYALAGLGRYDEAIALYTVAVDVLRGLGRRLDTADCLMAMARVQDRAGRGEGAKASYAAALEILDALDHPDAATVRECLAKQR